MGESLRETPHRTHSNFPAPKNKKPHKPDALSRLMRLPQQICGSGQRLLLLSGFLGQVIGSFAGMAHQDGARTGNLAQALEVGLHLETCGLEL